MVPDARGRMALRDASGFSSWARWIPILALTVAACTSQAGARGLATPDLSEFQRQILADGEVTFAEMERAALAYAECMREAGLQVDTTYREDISAYQYTFTAPSPEGFDDLVESADARCRPRYLIEVERAWADQAGPTREEETQFYEAIRQCLVDRGHAVPSSDRDELSAAYDRWPDDYDACFGEAERSQEARP